MEVLPQEIADAKLKAKQEQNKKAFRKKGRKRTNIGTQELKKVTDPDKRHSDISAGLRGVQQELYQMSRKLNDVQKSRDFALGWNRNVIAHGIPDPFMTKGEQRERVLRYHVVNLLPTVEIPERAAIKRAPGLGR